MTDVQTFNTSSPTSETDIIAATEAVLRAAYDKAASKPRTEGAELEVAEPRQLWNLYAVGPIFVPGPGPLPPIINSRQVLRVGERAAVATVMIVNRSISSLNLPYRLEYRTGNLSTWTSAPSYSTVRTGNLAGSPFGPDFQLTIDVYQFVAREVGCYEMNICADLLTCTNRPSEFGGFVRVVNKLDNNFPIPGMPIEPRIVVDTGIRFKVQDAP